MNQAGHWSQKRAWRAAACQAAQAWRGPASTPGGRPTRLPKGLLRVRIDIVLHFCDRAHRDRLNYRATTKPVVDGLGPPKPIMRSAPGGGRRTVPAGIAPGYGLLVDDSDEHLDGEHITIGEPVARPRYGPGGLVVVIVTVLDPTATGLR